MKRTGQCPKCHSSRVFHSPRVMDRGSGDVALELAIARTDPIHAHEVGFFEVYVCRDCGLAELYVRDLHRLDEIRADEGDQATPPAPAPTPGKRRTGRR